MQVKIGDSVIIHPAYSLHFGGRWGVVTEINSNEQLSYVISFGNRLMKFSREEFLTEEQYKKLNRQILCPFCGGVVTDLKVGYCEYCIREMNRRIE